MGYHVPVTARLSRKFYDTFGDEIANELVEWFNQVDATYRGDLRDLNELNFSRFDAKLEQRIAQLDTHWESRMAESNTYWERRMAESRAHWEQRMAESRAHWEQRFSELESRILVAIHESKAELMKWMFGSIFAAWITLLGTMIALVKLV